MLRSLLVALAFTFTLNGLPTHAQADAAADKATQKALKSLVGSIRYGKDDLAAKQIAFGAMSKGLLTDTWAKMTPAQQAEFQKSLEGLVRGLSFPKGKDMFQYLDAMLYDAARVEGDQAKVRSTVVVHRDYKKTEIIIDWVLVQEGGAWKVLDTVMLGESTLAGLRDEQVKPLVKEGGVDAVLKAMRDKLAELKK